MATGSIRLKRVYETPSPEDGVRVLVERLWPRGLTKERAAVDHWLKDLAPSPELRRWFGHDPARWDEFRRRYAAELDGQPDAVARLAALARGHRVTFVYAARDDERNSARLLRDYLESKEAGE